MRYTGTTHANEEISVCSLEHLKEYKHTKHVLYFKCRTHVMAHFRLVIKLFANYCKPHENHNNYYYDITECKQPA